MKIPSYISSNYAKFIAAAALGLFVIGIIVLLVNDDLDKTIETYIWRFVVLCFVVCTLGLGFLFVYINNWLFPNPELLGAALHEPSSGELNKQLYERANLHRRESYIVLAAIFFLTIGAAVVFFKSYAFASQDLLGLYVPDESHFAKISGFFGPEETKRVVTEALKSSPGSVAWVPFALMTALRIGDIAVASFLTLILTKLYRYNLRLSAFYYSRADALEISGLESFKKVQPELLPYIMDPNIEFGAELATIAQSVAQLVSSIRAPKDPPK